MAEEYAFAGDYRRAYETEREFKALSDELKRTEDQKRVAEASAAFEADKKRKSRSKAYSESDEKIYD